MNPQTVDSVGRGSDFVQSLERGLAVIHAFGGGSPALTPSDVARSTGLTRAAARRFLLTLVEIGYVRVDDRMFRLSPRVLELGRAYLSGLALPEVALPHLQRLVAGVRESSSLAVLDGADIIYIGHVAAKRILSVSVTVGGRDPAFATALGRVLLAAQSDEWLENNVFLAELPRITGRTLASTKLRAELARVRRQGWALVDQELEDGLRALAAPIHDGEGRVIAAANITLQASRWSIEAIHEALLPQILHIAAAIERDLSASVATAKPSTVSSGDALGPASARDPLGQRSDFVQSLERGLAVIRAFDRDNTALTLSEVARSTGLTRAAARRFLLTLVEVGYMQVEGRAFRLSPRVLELGRSFLSGLTLPKLALPHLQNLAANVRESSSLAALEGCEIVYIGHAAAKRIVSVSVTVGARDPAFATSLGRVLLAAQSDERMERCLSLSNRSQFTERTIVQSKKLLTELHRVRRQGWALVDQELEEGLRALAAPIRDSDGRVVAAANLTLQASRWSIEAIHEVLLPQLLRATAAIEGDIIVSGISYDLNVRE